MARARLEDQLDRLRRRADAAAERAYRALAAGQDDQARFFLTRRQAAKHQIALLAPQLEQLRVAEGALYNKERRLALRVEAVRQRRRAFVALKASRGIRSRLSSAAVERSKLRSVEPSWGCDDSTRDRKSA